MRRPARFALPAIAPSSEITPPEELPSGPFDFVFSIHQPSGTLLLLPELDRNFLSAVRAAIHREPESHLAESADFIRGAIAQTGPRKKRLSILGVTEKDRSLVNLLVDQGLGEGHVLFPELHSLEAQEILSSHSESFTVPAPDLLIVRHLLEHARDIDAFLWGLARKIAPGGLCLIEVPESRGLLSSGDLTQVWEEHTAYFTRETLRRSLVANNLQLVSELSLESEGEELCLAVVHSRSGHLKDRNVGEPLLATSFIEKLPKQLDDLRSGFPSRVAGREMYLFGANHVSGFFADLLWSFGHTPVSILDDDPQKWGKTMGLGRTKISSPERVDLDKPVHLIVGVAEGRAPALYNRLQTLFPKEYGHKVERLDLLYRESWT